MEESASAKIQHEANASIKEEHQCASSENTTEMQERPCIYKVPDPLRKLNKEAYGPQVISIGPFHRSDKKLQAMEEYKAKYLEKFIQRADIKMEDLKNIVKGLEERVRQCYAENFTNLLSDDFVTMILNDASFIVELFIRYWFDDWSPEDRVKLNPWLALRMQLDFILLENQLPFFIFDELFGLAFPSRPGATPFIDLSLFHSASVSTPKPTSFLELSFEYFKNINRHTPKMSPNPKLKILHFVDLLRNFYLPPPHRLQNRNTKIVERMYTATQLDGVGFKFEVDLSRNCLLDLELDDKKKVLKFPRFTLDNDTEIYVPNLLAFEQCHYSDSAYVTDYFIVLDFLINSEEDVDLLRRKGILFSGFGNKYATDFINTLGTGIIYSEMSSNYNHICKKLKDFYEKPTCWEFMRRNYFSTALRQAASIVTILTLIQTVCSIISVLPHH